MTVADLREALRELESTLPVVAYNSAGDIVDVRRVLSGVSAQRHGSSFEGGTVAWHCGFTTYADGEENCPVIFICGGWEER